MLKTSHGRVLGVSFDTVMCYMKIISDLGLMCHTAMSLFDMAVSLCYRILKWVFVFFFSFYISGILIRDLIEKD